MNLVMTEKNELVEIQGTAEGSPFTLQDLNVLLELGQKGINQLIQYQMEALGELNCLVGQGEDEENNCCNQ
jgi:RNase PH